MTPLIALGKFIAFLSQISGKGSGSTWPGHIALSVNKDFIKDIIKKNKTLKIILVAGTNGKTTTGKLIQTILEKDGKRVFQNAAGANLVNGIASTLLMSSALSGKINKDYAIFEIDENTLPLVLKELTPHYIIALNLFRDQLDRYGEVNTIASKWQTAIEHLPATTLILNADDPQIAFLGKNIQTKTLYFGLDDKKAALIAHQHASDSSYCPHCGIRLTYKTTYYSHIGDWACSKCKYQRPKPTVSYLPEYPLVGIYNRYNTNAAVLLARTLHIPDERIYSALQNFTPAFGRQETITIDGKKVQIFLSKNPASFNQSLRTITELGGKTVLFLLNDRTPDGKDVSWIWDIDIEDYIDQFKDIVVSGDRVWDMSMRLKYARDIQNLNLYPFEDLKKAVALALQQTPKNETLFILPTYSAMLEIRKILTGKKIL